MYGEHQTSLIIHIPPKIISKYNNGYNISPKIETSNRKTEEIMTQAKARTAQEVRIILTNRMT